MHRQQPIRKSQLSYYTNTKCHPELYICSLQSYHIVVSLHVKHTINMYYCRLSVMGQQLFVNKIVYISIIIS